MKSWIFFFCILVVGLCMPSASGEIDQAVDRATEKACQQIAEDLAAHNIEGVKNIAVLPVWGDADGYVLDTLKSFITRTPYAVMVRSDAEWDRLLGEIEWNTLREDIMNPRTVRTFGRIEGCDAILYGTVRQQKINPWTFKAISRLTVHLAEVETGQIVWSSKPVTASVWLEWPEIYQLAMHHPVVWIVGGLIVLLVIWTAFKKLFRAATRPR